MTMMKEKTTPATAPSLRLEEDEEDDDEDDLPWSGLVKLISQNTPGP